MMKLEDILKDPKKREAFQRWVDWHYTTHVRTRERFRMMWNRKTAEILNDMITDEIIRKHAHLG